MRRVNANGGSGGGTSPLILLDRQIFTTSGTWTKPADDAGNIASGKGYHIKGYLRGAGGSGGSTSSALANYVALGGGGGGKTFLDMPIGDAGASETVTIGAGGAAVQGSNGSDGGDTSFGSHFVAGGGEGGFAIEVLAASEIFERSARGGAGDVRGGNGSSIIMHTLSASQPNDLNRRFLVNDGGSGASGGGGGSIRWGSTSYYGSSRGGRGEGGTGADGGDGFHTTGTTPANYGAGSGGICGGNKWTGAGSGGYAVIEVWGIAS